jgi:hypothetical protein
VYIVNKAPDKSARALNQKKMKLGADGARRRAGRNNKRII